MASSSLNLLLTTSHSVSIRMAEHSSRVWAGHSGASAAAGLPVQGKNLADALGADKATYYLIEGAGHGGSQFETPENLQLVIDFLNQHLQ